MAKTEKTKTSFWLGSDKLVAVESKLAGRVHYIAKDGTEKTVDVSDEITWIIEQARREGREELRNDLKRLLF